MKLLVWHWGRHGAGPIFASCLYEALAQTPNTQAVLSLAASAEILTSPAIQCDWREPTYRNAAGYAFASAAAAFLRRRTLKKLQQFQPDFAICAMPALLDGRMIWSLARSKIPFAAIVHDAGAHPGDALRFRLLHQPTLLRNAAALFPLSTQVEAELRLQGYGKGGQKITKLWHPPFHFGDMKPAFSHTGRPRLLCFGRLLPYKGLDMLADALTALGSPLPFEVKICGQGPVSAELTRLRALPGVAVDRRWIPESELPALIEWSDAVVLPYREASQSGVAAAAIGQGRLVIATNVGGLPEQLAGHPGAILCAPTAAAIATALQQIKPAVTASATTTESNWSAMATKILAAL